MIEISTVLLFNSRKTPQLLLQKNCPGSTKDAPRQSSSTRSSRTSRLQLIIRSLLLMACISFSPQLLPGEYHGQKSCDWLKGPNSSEYSRYLPIRMAWRSIWGPHSNRPSVGLRRLDIFPLIREGVGPVWEGKSLTSSSERVLKICSRLLLDLWGGYYTLESGFYLIEERSPIVDVLFPLQACSSKDRRPFATQTTEVLPLTLLRYCYS